MLTTTYDSGHDYAHEDDGKNRPRGEYTFMEAVAFMQHGYKMKSLHNGREYFLSGGSGKFEGGDIVVESINGLWRAVPWRMWRLL
jgi:hypothetical protein